MADLLFMNLWNYITSRNTRILHAYDKTASRILELAQTFQTHSDEELRQASLNLVGKIQAGDDFSKVIEPALALACCAAQRTLGLNPYKVQIIGALTLLHRQIAEMKTGEGKTLTAALAAYARSLEGKGVHVVTANDYLAERDTKTMTPLFEMLGRSVGVVVSAQANDPEHNERKRQAYAADITYATSNEIGFDYLRSNLALSTNDQYFTTSHCAIVDEIDSILIDEARTPLIISGPSGEDTKHLEIINRLALELVPSTSEDNERDFYVDLKPRQIVLSDKGFERCEQLLSSYNLLPEGDSLYAPHNIILLSHVSAALKAHHIYRKDVDYIVRDETVQIVDERTGRVAAGRRWGEGVHQAIEAKEGLNIRPADQTLAAVSLQNLFRGYRHLSGMTGTAFTEQQEFFDIYNLEVVVIPTHLPMIRRDEQDLVFLSEKAKFERIIRDIIDIHGEGQPILLGTSSIQMTEAISERLKQEGIVHEVLNAKNHQREAQIVANAGRKGAVTIATNMAGRGTDIVLGGVPDKSEEWTKEHQEVLELGGLHVMGTERHESRRVDNQLRGRAGRQGDPGSSQFYVSFEDKLLKLFAPRWTTDVLSKMGMKEDDVITMPMVTKQIEKAQKSVESHHFSMRKSLFDYDDVVNRQRLIIYGWRQDLVANTTDPNFEKDLVIGVMVGYLEEAAASTSDVEGAVREALDNLWVERALAEHLQEFVVEHADQSMLSDLLIEQIQHWWEGVERAIPQWNSMMREMILSIHDIHWKEHLYRLDVLRQSVHFRQYAQKKPLEEYSKDSFLLYQEMIKDAQRDVVRAAMKMVTNPQAFLPATEQAPVSPEANSPEANSPEANSPEANSPEANSPEAKSPKPKRNRDV